MSSRVLRRLEGHPALAVAGAFALVLVVGSVDRVTNDRLSFSLFYLVPIGLTAWLAGMRFGLLLSCSAAAVSLIGDLSSVGLGTAVPAWNTLVRGGVFIIVTTILVRLRSSLDVQRALASTDPLTGVLNPRAFDAAAERELARALRYGRPLALAYIDLDGFKHVNDTLGHSVGDRLLLTVAAELIDRLRPTDLVARMGGDEFAILMPETSLHQAETTVARVRGDVTARMHAFGWPVSFSVGVIECSGPGSTVDSMIADADRLMYAHKARRRSGDPEPAATA